MRTLYLLRHGVADRKPSGGSDHDRPLAPAGRRASKSMGAHLAQTLPPPSLFLCSSARRAVETLEAVRSCLPAPAEVLCERGLYLAGSDEILQRICGVHGRHAAVLLVGHNPGIGQLAHGLVRPTAGGDYERLQREFPAGALAVLTFDVDRWFDIAPRRARLDEFTTPTLLASTR
jgi:phosphohistidine phosphatase